MFTVNGETGKSVAQYGAEWLKLVPYTKSLIRAGKNLGKNDVLVSAARPCTRERGAALALRRKTHAAPYPAWLTCIASFHLCWCQVGVSLNYNKMLGWLGFDYIASDYVATAADRQQFDADAKKYPIDLPSVRKLYQAVDVIGVSGAHAGRLALHALPCSSPRPPSCARLQHASCLSVRPCCV